MVKKRMKQILAVLTAVSIVVAGAKGMVKFQKRTTSYIPMK